MRCFCFIINIDGEVIYETSSNRLLKVQEDGDGMRTNAMSNIVSADDEIKDEDYFFQNGEEVADGAYEIESANLLKWKKDDVYYALVGGRTKNSFSKEEGSSEIRPEDDRLEGYQDLVKVDNDLAELFSVADKVLMPEKLPEGYKVVEIGYSYDSMRGYESYETEFWMHFENEEGDKFNMYTFSGYDDMSKSEMRNENETIEGVEVNTRPLETKFIVDDVYYEIEHNDLERDEKANFIENLLKL